MNIRHLWHSHRLLTLVFAAAFFFTAVFFVRTVVFMLHWAAPVHQEQTIEGWMPVRYVARSWDVPPEVLAEALGLEAGARPRLTVDEIAAERDSSAGEVADILYAAIREYRDAGDD